MAEISYRRHRFPPVIIQHAVWVYLRFTLSYRDVEELLAERGLDISYETVRCWVLKFTDLELVPHGSLLTPRWRGLDSNSRFRASSGLRARAQMLFDQLVDPRRHFGLGQVATAREHHERRVRHGAGEQLGI